MRESAKIRLLIGWSLLGLAWVFANPPLAAPDEQDHYIRAVGIGQGHLVGAPAPEARIGADPAEIRFDQSTQRAVVVPAKLDPTPFNCYLADPRLSAACIGRPPRAGAPARLVTSVGTYPPIGLLAAGAVVQAGENPPQAVLFGRLATMPIALALLIAAAAALFAPSGGWLSLVGILAACTPTAIFLASSLNPSGLSISAGIALTASLLRIGRDTGAAAGSWMLFGLSGALLVLSHPTGLPWALLLVAGFAAFTGIRTARRLAREHRGPAAFGIGVFAAGAIASLAWQAIYGPSTPIAYRGIRYALGLVPKQSWGAVRDLVGGFGYLEFRLPVAVYLLWFALVAVVVIAAVRAGSRRERNAVLAAGALACLIPVCVWMVFGRAVGIGINAREYIPFLVAFPMLAGEVVYRNRDRLSRAKVVALATVAPLAGTVQFLAWYLNGRRAAVGTGGPLLFLSDPEWEPPLGWLPWIAVAVCGVLLLASTSISSLSPRLWPRWLTGDRTKPAPER
ncbi:MAG: DUF2142 domain-containing protein [Solirubrobacterales bacterium]